VNITREDLFLHSPWLNAAGMLGFSPPRAWRWPVEMGAFVTNPVSRLPRSPASNRAAIPYPGGLLFHTGHPNPGLQSVLRRNIEHWRRLDVPIWVHLLGDDPGMVALLVHDLEECQDIVMAVEIGIPPGASSAEGLALVQAATGELPVIAAIPLTAAFEGWLPDLIKAGAAAISLTAPRGCLAAGDGRLVSGRLYGPSLFPLAMAGLQSALSCGLPVIAGCGVYTLADGEKLLEAGALAVQLDTVLWIASNI
jgi:dihydroorotate dehydrogenase (NAD+) catalytic subunit